MKFFLMSKSDYLWTVGRPIFPCTNCQWIIWERSQGSGRALYHTNAQRHTKKHDPDIKRGQHTASRCHSWLNRGDCLEAVTTKKMMEEKGGAETLPREKHNREIQEDLGKSLASVKNLRYKKDPMGTSWWSSGWHS